MEALTSKDLELFICSELETSLNGQARIAGGPAASIDVRACTVLAPVLQEVFRVARQRVNGFGTPTTSLWIGWNQDEQGHCVIECRAADESPSPQSAGVPAVDWPEASEGIPGDLCSDSMVRCQFTGLGARILVPPQFVSFKGQQDGRIANRSDPIVGRSLLVVEDQLIIALDLEMLLREWGAADVRVAGTVADALSALKAAKPDAAILDINLGSGTSIPIAHELLRLHVPFVFATGYGSQGDLPRELQEVPLVGKPYCVKSIRTALAATCMAGA